MPASADFLQTPLQFLKGVGPRKAADFARAGLNTVEDLLFRFPLRYEDRGHLQAIASLREGQTVSIAGKVITSGLRATRRPGVRIFEALLRDASGTVRLSWFNSAYLKDQIHAGTEMVVYGTFERNQWTGLQITNPQFEIVDGDEPETLHTGRIVPIYERARSITPKMQRRLVADALLQVPPDLPEPLPESVRQTLRVPGRRETLRARFPAGRCRWTCSYVPRSVADPRGLWFQVGLLRRRKRMPPRDSPSRWTTGSAR
jgi:ATP-dependent DNA helicase RecG